MAEPAVPHGEQGALANLVELVRRRPPPPGYFATLPDRGHLFVRAARGPRETPTVVLLHGWIASGGLNWFQAFESLRGRYRVIAPDLRGHARGIRSWRFKLTDCADDIAALLRKKRVQNAILVGYSMGGPVAKLVWRRHPELVSGLVLAATSARLARSRGIGLLLAGIMEAGAIAGRVVSLRSLFRSAIRISADPDIGELQLDSLPVWARSEVWRHDVRHLLEAGAEIGRFDSTGWLEEIDVPTSVLVTERDRAIPRSHQLALAEGIRGARVHKITGGHLSFAYPAFGGAIRAAVDSVAKRRPARA
ncbi:MAG: alpha/beta hydrolase [Deltaproteobacteria bacterium]|nr:MAG: alpha/beta hydrolase [Deltaproteobacteria bacterium]